MLLNLVLLHCMCTCCKACPAQGEHAVHSNARRDTATQRSKLVCHIDLSQWLHIDLTRWPHIQVITFVVILISISDLLREEAGFLHRLIFKLVFLFSSMYYYSFKLELCHIVPNCMCCCDGHFSLEECTFLYQSGFNVYLIHCWIKKINKRHLDMSSPTVTVQYQLWPHTLDSVDSHYNPEGRCFTHLVWFSQKPGRHKDTEISQGIGCRKYPLLCF